MNKYNLFSLIALSIFVIVFPIYAWFEPARMDGAQNELRNQFMLSAVDIYLTNCASCHGTNGEGIGVMPALNNPALKEAEHDLLYNTIAHSPHSSAMAAWHVEDGGILSSYEVEGLVTFLKFADWAKVDTVAQIRGLTVAAPAPEPVELAAMEGGMGEDPHECLSCHEEPAIHADRFGLNCASCHTLKAWTPALLTRHDFDLQHGDKGEVACQTCHVQTYSEYTCYECHDHNPAEMETFHLEWDIVEIEPCAECHPTGVSGEAELLLKQNSH